MRNILETRVGKEIEISFGAGAVAGKVIKIEDNVLHLEKDGQEFFVLIEKIVAVWDSKERGEKKMKSPGFVSPSPE